MLNKFILIETIENFKVSFGDCKARPCSETIKHCFLEFVMKISLYIYKFEVFSFHFIFLLRCLKNN